ncbi:N-acetylmuramoyl-L-alanine amidase [Chlorobium phaeovibrioides]|uniref:N-acetylmuramoyl-L-alanine amidase n=1 Tax=Chlorobium phaeovibrioides TaxID=1094 RepID=UPI001C8CACEE|nr:N-acetylmuramoyl-L-alanine amidase [Chlorobium phaeovibrioides]
MRKAPSRTRTAAAKPKPLPLQVILDNGHGRETPGKRSPAWYDMAQLMEWEFNRSIVQRVAESLSQLTMQCNILVPEEEDISITERIKRTNTLARQAREEGRKALLISIHANASPNQMNPGHGWECWTSKGGTQSDQLATMLYNAAGRYLGRYTLRKDMADGDPDKETNAFSLLSRTICPAVLTENLFMDNHDECEFLLSEQGRDLIAHTHTKAIIDYNRQFGTNHI